MAIERKIINAGLALAIAATACSTKAEGPSIPPATKPSVIRQITPEPTPTPYPKDTQSTACSKKAELRGLQPHFEGITRNLEGAIVATARIYLSKGRERFDEGLHVVVIEPNTLTNRRVEVPALRGLPVEITVRLESNSLAAVSGQVLPGPILSEYFLVNPTECMVVQTAWANFRIRTTVNNQLGLTRTPGKV